MGGGGEGRWRCIPQVDYGVRVQNVILHYSHAIWLDVQANNEIIRVYSCNNTKSA